MSKFFFDAFADGAADAGAPFTSSPWARSWSAPS